MLEQIIAEQGISLDDLPPPPPPGIDARLLNEAARAYAVAAHELGLESEGVVVAGKVARIASYLDGGDDHGAWDEDAVPNLLLIEKVLADVDDELERHGARASREVVARLEERGRLLRGLLAPLMERIPLLARQILAAMVAAGYAPSPFLRVKPGSPPSPPRA